MNQTKNILCNQDAYHKPNVKNGISEILNIVNKIILLLGQYVK
jgi:hypothetical protein